MPHGSVVKICLPVQDIDAGLIPGLGRSPGGGNGNPLQYSCLGNVWSLAGYIVHGVTKSQTQLSDLVHTHTHTKGLAYVKPLWHFVSQAGSSNSSSFVLAGGFSLQQVDSASFLFPSGWLVTCFDSWQCSRNDAGPDSGPVLKRTKGWNSKTPC